MACTAACVCVCLWCCLPEAPFVNVRAFVPRDRWRCESLGPGGVRATRTKQELRATHRRSACSLSSIVVVHLDQSTERERRKKRRPKLVVGVTAPRNILPDSALGHSNFLYGLRCRERLANCDLQPLFRCRQISILLYGVRHIPMFSGAGQAVDS